MDIIEILKLLNCSSIILDSPATCVCGRAASHYVMHFSTLYLTAFIIYSVYYNWWFRLERPVSVFYPKCGFLKSKMDVINTKIWCIHCLHIFCKLYLLLSDRAIPIVEFACCAVYIVWQSTVWLVCTFLSHSVYIQEGYAGMQLQ